MWFPTDKSDVLMHYAKGSRAKNHKYIAIKNGRYIYPKAAMSSFLWRQLGTSMNALSKQTGIKANGAEEDLRKSTPAGSGMTQVSNLSNYTNLQKNKTNREARNAEGRDAARKQINASNEIAKKNAKMKAPNQAKTKKTRTTSSQRTRNKSNRGGSSGGTTMHGKQDKTGIITSGGNKETAAYKKQRVMKESRIRRTKDVNSQRDLGRKQSAEASKKANSNIAKKKKYAAERNAEGRASVQRQQKSAKAKQLKIYNSRKKGTKQVRNLHKPTLFDKIRNYGHETEILYKRKKRKVKQLINKAFGKRKK